MTDQKTLNHAFARSRSNGGLAVVDVSFLRNVLSDCKIKLGIYRAQSGGQYFGGMEYTALIRNIDEASKLLDG